MISSALLLELHWLAAARETSIAAFGDDHLGAALATLIAFTNLICHANAPVDGTGRALKVSLAKHHNGRQAIVL
jgi:hypothetical protein